MAKTSTTTLSIAISGDGVSATYQPPGWPLANSAAPAGGPIATVLSSGDNSLAVPTGAIALLVVPASTSTVVKKLKGVGGDTGFTLAPATPSLLSLPTGATTVLLNASAGETVNLLWL